MSKRPTDFKEFFEGYKGLEDFVVKWSTQADVYKQLPLLAQKFYNALKSFLSNSSSVVWFHPKSTANTSVMCSGVLYNHWHFCVIPSVCLSNDSKWKTIRSTAAQLGLKITVQKVKNMIALSAHFMRKPRLFFGVRGMDMAEPVIRGWKFLLQNPDAPDEDCVSDEETEVATDIPSTSEGDGFFAELGIGFQHQDQVSEKPSQKRSLLEMFGAEDCQPGTSKAARIDEFDEENHSEMALRKQTMTAKRIEWLSEWMYSMGETDGQKLLGKFTNSGEMDGKDKDMFYACFTAGNSKHLFDKAAQIAAYKADNVPTLELLIHFNLNELPQDEYWPRDKSYELFKDWCDEQSICPINFTLTVYCVLKKLTGKRNCVVLEGRSNAGKTAILNSMLYAKSMVGQITKDEKFGFMDLVGKRIARIDELQLTIGNVDNMKKLFSGEPLQVDIKNQPSATVAGLPVFASCNNNVFQYIQNEDIKAIQNRCFIFKNLRPSVTLQDNSEFWGKKIDPSVFKTIYDRLRSFTDEEILFYFEQGEQSDEQFRNFVKEVFAF